MDVLAAAAIRDASSSMSKLEGSLIKFNHKVKTPTGKPKNQTKNDDKDSSKNRVDRYRPQILYDEDDENTSKPKLEKLINHDKERIEKERKQLNDKKNSKKESSREEKSKNKMDSSAGKFKMFLSADVSNKSLEKHERSSTNSDDETKEDDEDIIEVKTQSPAKVDLTEASSPQASGSGSCPLDSDSPPPFKPRNKRSTTSSESSAEKRPKRSESPENNASVIQTDQLLRGVVFVISGVQVKNYFPSF